GADVVRFSAPRSRCALGDRGGALGRPRHVRPHGGVASAAVWGRCGCVSGVTLDWSSAEVHDGQLEVGLRGELPKEWKDKFERTVGLLPRGDWGKVTLKKARVRVNDVAAGSE